jgi:hypothetical protein
MSCTLKSDFNLKREFAPVVTEAVLEKLASLPITTWRYIDDESGRHMGPMAQEFHEAFGLGSSDRTIQVVDALGISMASIQALAHDVKVLDKQNSELRTRNAELERRLSKLEEKLQSRAKR